jgi:hypothetical protein
VVVAIETYVCVHVFIPCIPSAASQWQRIVDRNIVLLELELPPSGSLQVTLE